MAGVKGRSGRRPYGTEEWKHRIIDKSWRIFDRVLDDKTMSDNDKLDIAKIVVSRDISRHQSQDVNLKTAVNYISNIALPATERAVLTNTMAVEPDAAPVEKLTKPLPPYPPADVDILPPFKEPVTGGQPDDKKSP